MKENINESSTSQNMFLNMKFKSKINKFNKEIIYTINNKKNTINLQIKK